MTEPAKTVTEEFVFRRLGDTFPLSSPDTSPTLLWGVCGGLVLMALLSVVIPLTRYGRASAKGGFLGALAGAVFNVLFGKVDDGKPGLWHYLAVGARAALFLTPVLFIGVARNFEVDTDVLWYAFTGVVLLLAWTLTVLMYVRDARAAGWWAAPLALLRMATLAVLAVCFLLPAYQTWEDTEKRSRVIVILDVSPSVTVWSDELSRVEGEKLKTRMDKILDFLTDDKIAFVSNLVKKNPVFVYRFGARLDDEAGALTADSDTWMRQDWEAFVKYDFKPLALKGVSADGQAKLTAAVAWRTDEAGTGDWPFAWIKAGDGDSGFDALTEADKDVVKENRAKIEKRIDLAKAIVQGTAVPDSITAAVNREAANMTQGIIVFSDGRSNIGSDSAFAELGKRAKEANIPVFTVGVGEAREVVSLVVSDLQAPDSTQPDEPTQVTVTTNGVGFKENEEVEVILELFLPGRDVKTDPADHEMRQTLKFAAGDPPHGETTFVLDAEEFAKKGAMTLVEEAPASKIGRKYQLKQGKDKGAWQVRAKVARDKREIFRDEYHLSPVRAMQVIDKPVRVLIVTSGASREYQTLRTLLVRETEQKRAEVSIYFQNEGGQEGTIVQDVDPGRLLVKFPDELDTAKKTTAGGEGVADAVAMSRTRYNNLDEYDVIVVFDPDWNEKDKSGQTRIPDGAMKKVKSWVENLGGGFVYVAGTFFTPQLARTDDENGRLTPIRDILPVLPDDVVLLTSKGFPRTYRRVKLYPTPDAELLRLDEEIALPEAEKASAGWERFFTGRDRFTPSAVPGEDWAPKRGFLTAYPVKLVKPGVKPLAEFIDVDEKGQPKPMAWYATTQVGAGRTAWIGSPEVYRLRQTDINYYDRFWLKLLRFAAAKRNAKTSRGQVLMGKEFVSGSPIRVQARVLQASGEAYPENDLDKPKFTIKQFDQNGNQVKEHGPFDVLKPTKLGAKFDGYYKGAITADPRQFPVDGFRYKIAVTKGGDLPEPLEGEFILRTSNPEMDNTKPDFAALTTAATGVKDVTDRIADADLRNKVVAAFGSKDADPTKSKLAFKLTETDKLALIPDCLRTESRVQRNRGAVDDIWDNEVLPPNEISTPLRGELFGPFRLWVPLAVVALALVAIAWIVRSRVSSPTLGTLMTLALLLAVCLTAAVVYCGNPFPVGIAVAAVCGLLCLEWLTRKLLRLA